MRERFGLFAQLLFVLVDLVRRAIPTHAAKRHPSPESKARAGVAARNMIARTRPDVVIAIDDDAQRYAARHAVGDCAATTAARPRCSRPCSTP